MDLSKVFCARVVESLDEAKKELHTDLVILLQLLGLVDEDFEVECGLFFKGLDDKFDKL